VKKLASILFVSMTVAAFAFAAKIDGKKAKEVMKVADELEFRVTDIFGATMSRPEGVVKMEITNKADTMVVVDLSKFTAMSINEERISVAPTRLQRLDGSEMPLGDIFEPVRKIKAGKTLKASIPFMGELLLSKEKPLKLYWKGVELFDIYE
jgi:hypothetical protein